MPLSLVRKKFELIRYLFLGVCGSKMIDHNIRDLFTYWFVDPKNVSTVCQSFIWPKVSHGLGLNPRALLPLQHAWARCAIERVDLKDKITSTTNANLNDTSGKAQILFVAMRFILYWMLT